MTVFLDTAVIMYAAGREHPLRGPCQEILERVNDRTLDATTSAEVVAEILHRFVALRQPAIGAAMARDALDLFSPVLPVTDAVMRRLPDLVLRYRDLAARDLIHVATCVEEGIVDIVSPDRGFDDVAEVRRIAPEAIGR